MGSRYGISIFSESGSLLFSSDFYEVFDSRVCEFVTAGCPSSEAIKDPRSKKIDGYLAGHMKCSAKEAVDLTQKIFGSIQACLLTDESVMISYLRGHGMAVSDMTQIVGKLARCLPVLPPSRSGFHSLHGFSHVVSQQLTRHSDASSIEFDKYGTYGGPDSFTYLVQLKQWATEVSSCLVRRDYQLLPRLLSEREFDWKELRQIESEYLAISPAWFFESGCHLFPSCFGFTQSQPSFQSELRSELDIMYREGITIDELFEGTHLKSYLSDRDEHFDDMSYV